MIERNINGVVDFCIAKVEEIDGRDDMDIEKKSRMMLAFFKEVRGYMTANLAYKKLLITAPDVAKNAEIVLQVGTPKLSVVTDTRATGT